MNKRSRVAGGTQEQSVPPLFLTTQYWAYAVGRKEKRLIPKNSHQKEGWQKRKSEKTACPTPVVDSTITQEQNAGLPITL